MFRPKVRAECWISISKVKCRIILHLFYLSKPPTTFSSFSIDGYFFTVICWSTRVLVELSICCTQPTSRSSQWQQWEALAEWLIRILQPARETGLQWLRRHQPDIWSDTPADYWRGEEHSGPVCKSETEISSNCMNSFPIQTQNQIKYSKNVSNFRHCFRSSIQRSHYKCYHPERVFSILKTRPVQTAT